jgi:signal transduction histidine kinase
MLALVEKDGSVKDAEVLFRKSDGSKFWSLMSFFPIEYAGQAARLGWIYDIEARKRAEEELRDAKERAENALSELKAAQQRLIQTEKMASLGQLTAGVAHEIKNPLNFVKNFSEVSVDILEELKGELRTTLEGLDEKKRGEALGQFATIEEMLAKIKEHGNRANTIVQSMLSHSREGPASAQLTDINELLEESLDLAYHAARAEDQSFNVSLERQFDAAVGSLDVYPADLMRVFLNLISNAFYATKKRAESSHESSYKPAVMLSTQVANASVEVRIRDNGTGISQSVKDKIFNPFFTTKPPGEGTGLGLSLSYETVVKQHGGWLEVSSEEGEYTEFLVTLPRAA